MRLLQTELVFIAPGGWRGPGMQDVVVLFPFGSFQLRGVGTDSTVNSETPQVHDRLTRMPKCLIRCRQSPRGQSWREAVDSSRDSFINWRKNIVCFALPPAKVIACLSSFSLFLSFSRLSSHPRRVKSIDFSAPHTTLYRYPDLHLAQNASRT